MYCAQIEELLEENKPPEWMVHLINKHINCWISFIWLYSEISSERKCWHCFSDKVQSIVEFLSNEYRSFILDKKTSHCQKSLPPICSVRLDWIWHGWLAWFPKCHQITRQSHVKAEIPLKRVSLTVLYMNLRKHSSQVYPLEMFYGISSWLKQAVQCSGTIHV